LGSPDINMPKVRAEKTSATRWIDFITDTANPL